MNDPLKQTFQKALRLRDIRALSAIVDYCRVKQIHTYNELATIASEVACITPDQWEELMQECDDLQSQED